jgi:hypothetical protein
MSRNQLMTVKVHYIVQDDQRMSIRELSNELGFSIGLVESTVKEGLGMKYVSVESDPKFLPI